MPKKTDMNTGCKFSTSNPYSACCVWVWMLALWTFIIRLFMFTFSPSISLLSKFFRIDCDNFLTKCHLYAPFHLTTHNLCQSMEKCWHKSRITQFWQKLYKLIQTSCLMFWLTFHCTHLLISWTNTILNRNIILHNAHHCLGFVQYNISATQCVSTIISTRAPTRWGPLTISTQHFKF
jgi:hypothetical protein